MNDIINKDRGSVFLMYDINSQDEKNKIHNNTEKQKQTEYIFKENNQDKKCRKNWAATDLKKGHQKIGDSLLGITTSGHHTLTSAENDNSHSIEK